MDSLGMHPFDEFEVQETSRKPKIMVYMKNPQSTLPPGFRFHPTDEELILHYLKKKVASTPFPVSIIADVDIYKFDPWDLPAKAAFGEKEWYFFSPRDRKYPNGARPNRAAASGYWKATGTDKIIFASSMGAQANIGVKKALVFYEGRPPKGVKTNWIMHEYRLADSSNNFNHTKPMRSKDSSMRLDDWVLCRIYRKSHVSLPTSSAVTVTVSDRHQEAEDEQFVHDDTLIPISKSPIQNNTLINPQESSSFSNLMDALDYSMLSNILSENQTNIPSGFESNPRLITSEMLDQQHLYSFSNGTTNYTNTSFTNSFLIQKLPQLNYSSVPNNMENNYKLKRPHTNVDDLQHMLHPSKKFTTSCSFIGSTASHS